MGKLIIVADDEPDVLKVVVFRLKKMGFEVIMTGNGQEAIDMMKKRKPDLLFLDFRMPVLNGVEACKQIRLDPDLKDVPVILITASCDDVVENAKICGASDYVIKPFDLEDLEKKVMKYLG